MFFLSQDAFRFLRLTPDDAPQPRSRGAGTRSGLGLVRTGGRSFALAPAADYRTRPCAGDQCP
jgi:hypothetical protein